MFVTKVIRCLSACLKLKNSDDQTNIDKYRVAANIAEYHIISKLIFRRIIIQKFMIICKAIISCCSTFYILQYVSGIITIRYIRTDRP